MPELNPEQLARQQIDQQLRACGWDVQPSVAQFPSIATDEAIWQRAVAQLPWAHNIILIQKIKDLPMRLWYVQQAFAFVGRQVHMEVGDDDFYIDLLFYHLNLRCFIVIDLKVGKFKAEYAGKMNFYLNAVDDRMKHETDHPTIGLILCEDKNKIVAEYALRGMNKAIGVSAYELTRALPKKLQSALRRASQVSDVSEDGR